MHQHQHQRVWVLSFFHEMELAKGTSENFLEGQRSGVVYFGDCLRRGRKVRVCWMELMDTYLFQANLLDQNGGVCWIYADLYWCYRPTFWLCEIETSHPVTCLPYLIFFNRIHNCFPFISWSLFCIGPNHLFALNLIHFIKLVVSWGVVS